MNRRGFLKTILAAGVAPAVVGSGILMPVRQLWITPGYEPWTPENVPQLVSWAEQLNQSVREIVVYDAVNNEFLVRHDVLLAHPDGVVYKQLSVDSPLSHDMNSSPVALDRVRAQAREVLLSKICPGQILVRPPLPDGYESARYGFDL